MQADFLQRYDMGEKATIMEQPTLRYLMNGNMNGQTLLLYLYRVWITSPMGKVNPRLRAVAA